MTHTGNDYLLNILEAYAIDNSEVRITPLTSGLINHTWKVKAGNQNYILQQINTQVFKRPEHIAENIEALREYLSETAPTYLFVAPLQTQDARNFVVTPEKIYFRLFPFISGSYTLDAVTWPEEAFEAAFQFGQFTRVLTDFNAGKLHITIPEFHNLELRYAAFSQALQQASTTRLKKAEAEITAINAHVDIITTFKKLKQDAQVKQRTTHHDTKISNVLFNEQRKGICVIDLDTVMPGYFISDLGDMMRTYLSPCTEEEQDFTKIEIRADVFTAVVQGYLTPMADQLSAVEKDLIFYSGQFSIYLQALRFLTDYLNNDTYYPTRYEDHNHVRAANQLHLLNKLLLQQQDLQHIISTTLRNQSHYRFS